MCSFCGWTPCDSRCPNAPEPTPIDTCKYCGEGILKGDEIFKIEDDSYHVECASDAALGILTEKFGAVFCTAEPE